MYSRENSHVQGMSESKDDLLNSETRHTALAQKLQHASTKHV